MSPRTIRGRNAISPIMVDGEVGNGKLEDTAGEEKNSDGDEEEASSRWKKGP